MAKHNALAKVNLNCEGCGSGFTVNGSEVKSYGSREGSVRRFCSRDCADGAKLKAAPTFACAHCGEVSARKRVMVNGSPRGFVLHQKFCGTECRLAALEAAPRQKHCAVCDAEIKGRGKQFCSRECRASAVMGHALGNGDGHLDKNGYRVIRVDGVEVMEHRVVLAQKIGRPLTDDETAHHINGIRNDNRPENLELWSSRHGKGQRVVDKVAWAIELIQEYPEVFESLGYEPLRQKGELGQVVIHPASEYLSALMSLN